MHHIKHSVSEVVGANSWIVFLKFIEMKSKPKIKTLRESKTFF